jgi:acetyl-CoA carboxylase carboxyltransferase component
MDLPEEQREQFVQAKRDEYKQDIDIYHLASELIVDAVIPGEQLRDELTNRFEMYANKQKVFSVRRNPVSPV